MAKKQNKIEEKPKGFSPNVMLMVGGLQKFVEDKNYTVEQARMFYSIIKASLQDSFNTWASTHTIAELPMVGVIKDYEKKDDMSVIFRELKGDIIDFLQEQAATANVENFMLAINETATELDNKVIISRQNEEAKNYK